MNNDRSVRTVQNRTLIDDLGFAAMLRRDDVDTNDHGILGAPRRAPTRAGLWIEDFEPATIDAIMLEILESFARRETVAAGDRNS